MYMTVLYIGGGSFICMWWARHSACSDCAMQWMSFFSKMPEFCLVGCERLDCIYRTAV